MRSFSNGTQLAWGLAFLLIVAGNGVVWHAILVPAEPQLHVSVLDVGQGDALLIEGPTGIDMLIDGGPDRSILTSLPRELGLFNRHIDLMVATHPDKDHIAGLIEVLERYRIGTILTSGAEHDTSFVEAFDAGARTEPGASQLIARRGMRIHLGGGAYADVLYPDRDMAGVETNAASIVMRVVYGSTAFMLTGDAPSAVEDYLVSLDPGGAGLGSTVLKAGHHGSRTSTEGRWLDAVSPQVVAISAGKENRYGHPHTEVVERVRAYGATLVSTIDSGTLRFVSDGQMVTLEK